MRPKVMSEETFIGHLLRKISKVCSVFLRENNPYAGSSIRCNSTVTGNRRYSSQKFLCKTISVKNFSLSCLHKKIFLHEKSYLRYFRVNNQTGGYR